MQIKDLAPDTNPDLLLDFTNNTSLDPRITFSRSSTATYYDGKTFSLDEENLLLYSTSLAVPWTWWTSLSGRTLNSSELDPFNRLQAKKLVADSSVDYKGIYQYIPVDKNQQYTFSVYAKAAEYSKLHLCEVDHNRVMCRFNLLTGTMDTVSGNGTNLSSSIVDAGNGWYRCSVTFTTLSNERATLPFFISPYPDTGTDLSYMGATYAGDMVSGLLVYGPQIERRSAPSIYVPTKGVSITKYIPRLSTAPANTPRFDHDTVTGDCKGLLVERKSSNLVPYSIDFTNYLWSSSTGEANLYPNACVAPDGTMTASKITSKVKGKGVNWLAHSGPPGSSINTERTISIYVKSAGLRYFALSVLSTWDKVDYNYICALFDLQEGKVVSTGYAHESAEILPFANEWYRVSVSVSHKAPGYDQFRIGGSNYDSVHNLKNYVGDGLSGFYIWGAQYEQDSFGYPTSYIPTNGSQATRVIEEVYFKNSDFYRQDESSLFAEMRYLYSSGKRSSNRVTISLNKDWFDNNNRILIYNNAGSAAGFYSITKGAYQASVGTSLNTDKLTKVALGLKKDNLAHSFNGSVPYKAVSFQLPEIKAFMIGGALNNSAKIDGHIKRISYYAKRLSDAHIQSMTY